MLWHDVTTAPEHLNTIEITFIFFSWEIFTFEGERSWVNYVVQSKRVHVRRGEDDYR